MMCSGTGGKGNAPYAGLVGDVVGEDAADEDCETIVVVALYSICYGRKTADGQFFFAADGNARLRCQESYRMLMWFV